MSNDEINWIHKELRMTDDIDSINILIDENSEILQDNELFEKIISLLEEEKPFVQDELKKAEISKDEEAIEYYKQERSNINIIIGVLRQRKAMEQDQNKRTRKIQEEYPFLTGNSEYQILFSGYSLDDIKRIPKTKLPTVLSWIQSQHATKLLLDNTEGIKRVNEKRSQLSMYNVKFARSKTGEFRIGFYRKGKCTVILGIVLRTGNDIDYDRYDSIINIIDQVEKEREDLVSGSLPSNSEHYEVLKIINQKLMSLQSKDDYPLEQFIPDIEETFEGKTEEEIAEIVGSYHSEWYYMYRALKGIYDKYYSIDEKVLKQFPEVDFIKWIREQRKLYRAGELKEKRVKLLEELGIQFDQQFEEEPPKKELNEEIESPKQTESEAKVWTNPLLSLTRQERQTLKDDFIEEFKKVADYYQKRGTLKIVIGLKRDMDALEVRQILRKWKRTSYKKDATPLQLQLVNELLELEESSKHQVEEVAPSKEDQDNLDSKTIDKILDLTENYYLLYGTTEIPLHYKVDGFELGKYLERLRQLVLIPGAVSNEQIQRIKELSSYTPEKELPSQEQTQEIKTVDDIIDDVNNSLPNSEAKTKDTVEADSDYYSEVDELIDSEEKRTAEKKEQLKAMIDEMSEEEIDTLMELLNNTSSK